MDSGILTFLHWPRLSYKGRVKVCKNSVHAGNSLKPFQVPSSKFQKPTSPRLHPPPSMDLARSLMGEVDRTPKASGSSSDEEEVQIDNTSAPPSLRLTSVLMDRHWVFEEVLYIKGAGASLSRSELQSAVSGAKGVPDCRVCVCFFDEDELSHPTCEGRLGAAGHPRGDVVGVWSTQYRPANFRRQSRKWKKIERRMEGMPRRWYLVTAIRKDGLLDDERDQHLSAEEAIERPKTPDPEEEAYQKMWLPPMFDERKKLTLKEQYAQGKGGG